MDPIRPINDPRITHCNAILNGVNYHYLLSIPPNGYKSTIFLIHGWPDLSLTWRHLIPTLLSQNYRIICPDMIGYGGTDAPNSLDFYTYKRAADDIKELAHQLHAPKIILGGHDWGGAIVHRTVLWYPNLITHAFTICTPYTPPSSKYTELSHLIPSRLPNFGYQLQLASGEVESRISTKAHIKGLLNGMYGGKGIGGEIGFDVRTGIRFEHLPKLQRSRLIDEEMLEYYTEQYFRNGIHSTLNWYRTRFQNSTNELPLTQPKTKTNTKTHINIKINIPVLFIQATKDEALPSAMAEGMEYFIPNLTRKAVVAGHWALWEKPEEVCGMIREWLGVVDRKGESRL